MKKKIRLILLFGMLFFTLSKASSETHFDFESGWYYYVNYTEQCNAKNPKETFLNVEKLRSDFVALSGARFVSPIGKLTKTMNRLIWKALNKYDVEDGEVYSVVLLDNYFFYYLIRLVIADNGNSYYWWDVGVFEVPKDFGYKK